MRVEHQSKVLRLRSCMASNFVNQKRELRKRQRPSEHQFGCSLFERMVVMCHEHSTYGAQN